MNWSIPEEYVEGALVRALMEAQLDIPTIARMALLIKPSDQARWRVMDRAIRFGPKVERNPNACLEAIKVLYSAGYPIPANGVYLAYCDELPMPEASVNARARAMASLLQTMGARGADALMRQCARFGACRHHVPFVQSLIDAQSETPKVESTNRPNHAMGVVYEQLCKRSGDNESV